MHAPNRVRAEIVALAQVYSAKVVDITQNTLVLEISGGPPKVQSFVDMLHPYGIQEMVRTGRIAMVRGSQVNRARTPAPPLAAAGANA